MDAVLRASAVYVFLLILFRLSGKRTLSSATTFDFVLLLIIAETTQQALLGDDFSITNSVLLIVSLLGIDIGLSYVKGLWPRFARIADSLPLVILKHGEPLEDRMKKARLDKSDILMAAREHQGLERLDQIKYAILEQSGGITIVPERR